MILTLRSRLVDPLYLFLFILNCPFRLILAVLFFFMKKNLVLFKKVQLNFFKAKFMNYIHAHPDWLVLDFGAQIGKLLRFLF